MNEDAPKAKPKRIHTSIAACLVAGGILLVVLSNFFVRSHGEFSSAVLVPRSAGLIIAVAGMLVFLLGNAMGRYLQRSPAKAEQKNTPGYDQAKQGPQTASGEPSELHRSSGVAEVLKETRPWVSLMSVIHFIGAGFLALMGLGFMFMAFTGQWRGPAAAGYIGAFVYLAMGSAFVFPGIFLMQYAQRITTFLQSPSTTGLEQVLVAQRNFWRFIGILSLIVLVLELLGFSGALLLQVVSMMR